ncbi:SHOCT domain-containing protein [Schaedlerella arabinosiphila]|uniref:SHOCT domain-containing protein n=1 Tax=Schaedlerella arabinosiphila TaxID=2044587 RepID=UPI002F3FF477
MPTAACRQLPKQCLPHCFEQNIKSEVLLMKSEKLLQYSIELSLLTQLLQSKLITENEYQKIKQKLMKEYKITSDLTAMIA